MDQNNGGILGKINTPTTSVASGVWSLDSQFEAQSGSTWPLAFPQTTIANSLRFDDGSSDYLNRTPASAGSQTTWTWSCWVKRSGLGTNQSLLSAGSTTQNNTGIIFNSSNQLQLRDEVSSSVTINITTDAVYRDVSAWYHIIFSFDSTQGTEADRLKIYVNGVEQAYTVSTSIGASETTFINDNVIQKIGGLWSQTGTAYVEGYMAEVVFIDGTALDSTSFGAFNPVTNIWEPIAYAGTYGTNGFRLDFADSSALGNDVSGNNNDFTVNNLTSIDQSTDTCSNNFATLNSLASVTDAPTFSDGNLTIDISNAGAFGAESTIGVSQGKWYAEFKLVASSDNDMAVGVNSDKDSAVNDSGCGFGSNSIAYRETGTLAENGTDDIVYGSSYTVNDIVGIALDLDNNKIYFSKNGVFQNSGDPTSGATGTGAKSLTASSSTELGAYFFNPSCHSETQNGDWSANFGNPPYSITSGNSDGNGYGNFEYSVPSGYYALNTKNLAEYG